MAEGAADTLVVGSGMAGLTCAVVLARTGRRVTVLEAHRVPGGCLQRFSRRLSDGRVMRFDTGVHYVGSLSPGQVFWRMLRFLGISLDTLPLDPEGFDHFSFPAFEFAVPRGWSALQARLEAAFPVEGARIDAFVKRIREAEAALNWHSLQPEPEDAYDPQLYTLSLAALLERLGISGRLSAILRAHTSLHGAPASRAPLAVHAAVMGSVVEGPHTIAGGGDALAGAFSARLADLGANLRTGSSVESVRVEGDRVAGVRLESGEELAAREVVLALHPKEALRLMPPDAFRTVLRERIEGAKQCVGPLCVYAATEPEADLSAIEGRNRYLFAGDDPDGFFEPPAPDLRDADADVFVSLAPREGDMPRAVTLMGVASMDWFEPWAQSRTGRRDSGYRELKTALARRLLRTVERRLPELRGRLSIVDAAGPLTMRDYLRYPGGGLYGQEPNLESQGRFGVRRRTRYKGLVLSGCGTGVPGIFGACAAGFATAGLLLGDSEALIREVARETAGEAESTKA